MSVTEAELKKMKKAAGEAVRRGVEYADWEAECLPRLLDGSNEIAATNLCSEIWRTACEAEGLKL